MNHVALKQHSLLRLFGHFLKLAGLSKTLKNLLHAEGRCAIVTDTSEKEHLELKQLKCKPKAVGKCKKRLGSFSDNTHCKAKRAKKKVAAQAIVDDSDSESDVNVDVVCDDDSDDDLPLAELRRNKPVKRLAVELKSAVDNCVICGEAGPGGEWWFRCVRCGYWVHKDCSGVDIPDEYVCDWCR